MRATVILFMCILSFAACATNFTTPTKRSYEFPQFSDDMDFEWMETAIKRQLEAYDRSDMRGTIQLGTVRYPLKKMRASLDLFLVLIRDYKNCLPKHIKSTCVARLNNQIEDQFNLYIPKNVEKAVFTAYYSPNLEASKVKTEEFKYGIYLKPTGSSAGKTRNQIMFDGALEDQGLSLFYVKDPFELYLLHIEGGGQATVHDKNGNKRSSYLSYAGSNGKSFRFISRYMIAQGMIDDSSTDSQKKYLAANPQDWKEIYAQCPSYIWFKETVHPPVGLNDIPLTDFRSIAQDSKLYRKKGLLSFVQSKKPYRDSYGDIKYKRFSRFMVDQDTGGAIKGEARADLYFGVGKSGELAAHNLKDTSGKIHFLIKK